VTENPRPEKSGAILNFTQDPSLYFRVAAKHAIGKDYSGALKYIDMAIVGDAYNADFLFNKACILVELKRTRESIKILNYIICNIDPTYTECYFGLGCNYFEIGNYEKSIQYFEKYIFLEEDGDFKEDAYEILLYMKISDEEEDYDPEGGLGVSEHAQRRCRELSQKLHAAGSMYLKRGNYKEAIRQFEKSIMEYPETKSSRIRLSMAYYMNGQLTLAKLLADSVLKIQKSNCMAKLCLALYYSTEGMNDVSERILSVFSRMRGRKRRSVLEDEDHALYEHILNMAPVGDDMKLRLQGVSKKLR
jgi:tetratricopeptide (TPR) repeat protein